MPGHGIATANNYWICGRIEHKLFVIVRCHAIKNCFLKCACSPPLSNEKQDHVSRWVFLYHPNFLGQIVLLNRQLLPLHTSTTERALTCRAKLAFARRSAEPSRSAKTTARSAARAPRRVFLQLKSNFNYSLHAQEKCHFVDCCATLPVHQTGTSSERRLRLQRTAAPRFQRRKVARISDYSYVGKRAVWWFLSGKKHVARWIDSVFRFRQRLYHATLSQSAGQLRGSRVKGRTVRSFPVACGVNSTAVTCIPPIRSRQNIPILWICLLTDDLSFVDDGLLARDQKFTSFSMNKGFRNLTTLMVSPSLSQRSFHSISTCLTLPSSYTFSPASLELFSFCSSRSSFLFALDQGFSNDIFHVGQTNFSLTVFSGFSRATFQQETPH